MNVVWRILNVLMAVLFLFAAALQLNDDDPVRWLAIYAAAALPCVLVVVRRKTAAGPAAVVAAISIVWAIIYAGRGAWSVPPSEMFAEWEMKNAQVRETREMFGLLIIATWMIAMLVVHRFTKSKS